MLFWSFIDQDILINQNQRFFHNQFSQIVRKNLFIEVRIKSTVFQVILRFHYVRTHVEIELPSITLFFQATFCWYKKTCVKWASSCMFFCFSQAIVYVAFNASFVFWAWFRSFFEVLSLKSVKVCRISINFFGGYNIYQLKSF